MGIKIASCLVIGERAGEIIGATHGLRHNGVHTAKFDLQQCMGLAAGRAQMSDLKGQTARATDQFAKKCVRRN
jgi:hypothetical protein